MVITMASYALQTPPRVAHAKPPGPIRKAKVPKNLKGSVLGHPVLIMTCQFQITL